MKKSVLYIFVLIIAISIVSCATTNPDGTWSKQQKGMAWGAGIGTAVGAITGAIFKGEKGALWGGLIGAAAGGLTGSQVGVYMDRQQRSFEETLAQSEAASIQREGDNLRLTFKGDVYFDTNSSEIKPEMYSELDRVAGILAEYPQTWIEVGGHADPRGTDEYNVVLSQRRADAVSNALAAKGVNVDRIRSVGYGESRLLSTNPDNYGINRRVEIKITPMR